jgi:hypothetical protein
MDVFKTLILDTSDSLTSLTGTLPVTSGGTGRTTSTTAYGLIAAGTTATGALQTLPTGATTQLLVGGGASALPVWTTATGSGSPVRATSPTLVTPVLGAATATSINGNTFTTGTYTLTGTAGKTLTFSNTLTLAGTDSTTMTFPSTSATIARTDAAQTFTGTQTFSGTVLAASSTAPLVHIQATADTINPLLRFEGWNRNWYLGALDVGADADFVISGSSNLSSPMLTIVAATKAATFAGAVTNSSTTTLSGALTYGGVTLSNSVTGTGSMVLSSSPTLTGTITAAAANFSGANTIVTGTTGPGLTISTTNAGNLDATLRVQNLGTTANTAAGIEFITNNTTPATRTAAALYGQMTTTTAGAEIGQLIIATRHAGIASGSNAMVIGDTGIVTLNSTTEATTGGAGSLTTAGGIYAAKKIITGSTTASTSTTTGSLINAGGFGNAGAFYNGGDASIGTAGANANLTIGAASPSGNNTSRLKFLNSNTVTNWQIASNDNVAGVLEFTASTATGGSTFSTPILKLSGTGATGVVTVAPTTASTSTTTGSLINAGGFGNAGAAYFGDNINVSGTSAFRELRIVTTTSGQASLLAYGYGTGTNTLAGQEAGGVVLSDKSTTASQFNAIQFTNTIGTNAKISAVHGGTTNAGSLLFATRPAGGSLTTALTIGTDQSATFAGTIATAAGSAWNLGAAAVVSPTSPNRTIKVTIAGVDYYIAAKTTND